MQFGKLGIFASSHDFFGNFVDPPTSSPLNSICAVSDFTMSDFTRMIGAPFAPPPNEKPATRALYFNFVHAATMEPDGRMPDAWLLAGGIPDPVDVLDHDTRALRQEHSVKELRDMAASE
jgi:hypothetical protein